MCYRKEYPPMKRFCLFLILLSVVVFAFVPAVEAEDQPVTPASGRLEISYAWYVGDTEAMQNLASNVPGLEHFSEGFLPLSWQNYLENKVESGWTGATLTDGKKSYNLIMFPWQSRIPSFSEIEELTKKIAKHPLGKYYFPDGNFNIIFPDPGLAMLLQNDMPPQFFLDKTIESDIMEYWQQLTSEFLIGVYTDHSKIPPKEGETQKDSDKNNDRVMFGIYPENDDRERLVVVWKSIAPEDSPQTKAAAARFNNDVPFRVGGFFSNESSIKVLRRIFPEDVGLTAYSFCVGTYLKPLESREENKIYSTHISFHVNQKNNATIPDRNTVFRKGDFEFSFRPQEELPPEEGVPTAKEIDAANMALHKSLEPLINEIADKFAQSVTKGPVDIAVKIEDDIFLFAIACEPDENSTVIDWSLLEGLNLTMLEFPNPYVGEQKPFLQNIMISETETWQDMTMTDFVMTSLGHERHFVLGQGNGILCGAVYFGEEGDEETSPDDETIVPRMITALKKGIEDSRLFTAKAPTTDAPNIIHYNGETEEMCVLSFVGKNNGEYISTIKIYVTSPATMALASQFFGGMFGSSGLAP